MSPLKNFSIKQKRIISQDFLTPIEVFYKIFKPSHPQHVYTEGIILLSHIITAPLTAFNISSACPSLGEEFANRCIK